MTAKRSRPKAPVAKVPVLFRHDDVVVEYVGRAKSELLPELERIRSHILVALKLLFRLRRHRHIVISTTRVQLTEALRSVPKTFQSPNEIAYEIARLSYTMEDAVNILARLVHSRTPLIEQIRFKLTYGQTPKQREPAGTYGNISGSNQSEETTSDSERSED